MTDTPNVGGDHTGAHGHVRLVTPESDSPAPDVPVFQVSIEPLRDTVRVAVTGEIDIATAPAVGAELTQMIDAGFRRVVLDLRDVSFMDSTAIRTILTAKQRAQEHDVAFTLVEISGPVKRILDIAGLTALLPFVNPAQIAEPSN